LLALAKALVKRWLKELAMLLPRENSMAMAMDQSHL
jgi:hypothetical protein